MTCHPPADAAGSVLFLPVATEVRGSPQTQASRPEGRLVVTAQRRLTAASAVRRDPHTAPPADPRQEHTELRIDATSREGPYEVGR